MKKINFFLMAILLGLTMTLTGCSRSKEDIQDDVCPVVEDILKKTILRFTAKNCMTSKKSTGITTLLSPKSNAMAKLNYSIFPSLMMVIL